MKPLIQASSDEYEDDPGLLLTYFIISNVVVAIYLPSLLVLLYRIRFQVDLTAKVILFAFTLCFIIRAVVNTVCLDPHKCNDT